MRYVNEIFLKALFFQLKISLLNNFIFCQLRLILMHFFDIQRNQQNINYVNNKYRKINLKKTTKV